MSHLEGLYIPVKTAIEKVISISSFYDLYVNNVCENMLSKIPKFDTKRIGSYKDDIVFDDIHNEILSKLKDDLQVEGGLLSKILFL